MTKHPIIHKPFYLSKDQVVFISLLFFLPLLFYNLGSFSLVDFDEAWFAEIARNIILTKNPLVLTFNQTIFSEHPPFGYLLMSISFVLFGISEFTARLPSALFAFIAIWATYLLGKKLFNRAVGICASLVLVSSVWFIFRARSGNLDTIFLGLYVLSFYLGIRIKENVRYFWFFCISFALLLLTKTLIGITVLLPIISYLCVYGAKIRPLQLGKGILLIFLLISPWIIANYLASGFWFIQHILVVGARPFGLVVPNFFNLLDSLTFQYLHFGIRKWYYPFLISLVCSLPFIPKHKSLISVYVLFIVLLTGFLTNTKTEIWHLIPLYPFIGLCIGFFIYHMLFMGLKLMKLNSAHSIASYTSIIFIAFFAFCQIYLFRNEVKLFDQDVSGLAKTAQAARKRDEKLYLYADYFLPGAVFYSQKQVHLVAGEAYPKNTLVGIIDSGDKPFLLLGEEWKFDVDAIDPKKYEVLSKHKEYMLILVK